MKQKKYIHRIIEQELTVALTEFPVLVLTGPRQTGKSTLLKTVFKDYEYISLDDPILRQLAQSDPQLFLDNYSKKCILDEIQYAPELLPYIKIQVDNNRSNNGQFILTGSQIFNLMSGLTESLAGRAVFYELLGLSFEEIKSELPITRTKCFKHLITGFYPEPLIHNVNAERFYASYLQSYLERDIRQISSVHDFRIFQDFLELLATRAGSLLNLNEISKKSGVSFTTAKRWLSLLETSRIIYLLRPYTKNISKRIIKSPKLYFTDTGLLTYLLRYSDGIQLEKGPMSGHIFENMVIIEALKQKFNKKRRFELYFFRDSNFNEIDLILEYADKTLLIEIKTTRTIRLQHGQQLQKMFDIFRNPTGYLLGFYNKKQKLTSNVEAMSWEHIFTILDI